MAADVLEAVGVDLGVDQVGLVGAVFRYEVLERLARTTAGKGVRLLAFGFADDELRLVLEGDPADRTNTLRGLKVGTLRAVARWGLSLEAGPNRRRPVSPAGLFDAVVWCHRAPVEAGADGPLASPWSSHRDVLGFRRARFYDASALGDRVSPEALHVSCGGEPLGRRSAPTAAPGHEDLGWLLRIAAAVIGVLPADRRCFRLFVHLGRARGWDNAAMAHALALTDRRVRQLAAEPEPRMTMALAAIGGGPLARVP